MRLNVVVVSAVLLIIMISLSFMMPVNVHAQRGFSGVPLVRFIDLVVPAKSLGPLIGSRVSSLRLAVYAGGRFFEGGIWVIPRLAKSHVALYNSPAEVPVYSGRVSSGDLLYLEIPLVSVNGVEEAGQLTGDWGIQYVKLRLHNRIPLHVAAEDSRGRRITALIYVYFDKNVSCPPIPAPPRLLEAARDPSKLPPARILEVNPLGVETHRAFTVDRRLTRILGYCEEKGFGVRPGRPSPDFYQIDGGGGGESPVSDAVFAIHLYNGTIDPGEPVSIERYLGYAIAYPKLHIRARSLGGSGILTVIVETSGTRGWHDSEAVSYELSGEPRVIEDYLPIPYTTEEAVNITVTFTTYGSSIEVYSNIFLGKDYPPFGEHGEIDEAKPAISDFVDGEWSMKTYYLGSGTVTFHAASINGLLLESGGATLGLEFELKFIYRDVEEPPIGTVTLEVYLNNVLIHSEKLDVSSGMVHKTLTLMNSDGIYPALEYSVKTMEPVTLTIRIPEIDDSYQDPWLLRVSHAYCSASFIPDIWMPGNASYNQYDHLLGWSHSVYYASHAGASNTPVQVALGLVDNEYEYRYYSYFAGLREVRAVVLFNLGKIPSGLSYDRVKYLRLDMYFPKDNVAGIETSVPAMDFSSGARSTPPGQETPFAKAALLLYQFTSTLINLAESVGMVVLPEAASLALAIGNIASLAYSIFQKGVSQYLVAGTEDVGNSYRVYVVWEGDVEKFLRVIVKPAVELDGDPGSEIMVTAMLNAKTSQLDDISMMTEGFIVIKQTNGASEPPVLTSESGLPGPWG